MTTKHLAAAALFLSLLSAGCANGFAAPIAPEPPYQAPPPDVTPASIRLVGSSQPDRTIEMTATVLTKGGSFVPGVVVRFSSSSGSMTVPDGLTDAAGSVKSWLVTVGDQTRVTASGAGLSASVIVIGPPTVSR
ncbi:MAG: hypothetical protein V4597_08470 [Pseudomonadota bacterium]